MIKAQRIYMDQAKIQQAVAAIQVAVAGATDDIGCPLGLEADKITAQVAVHRIAQQLLVHVYPVAMGPGPLVPTEGRQAKQINGGEE